MEVTEPLPSFSPARVYFSGVNRARYFDLAEREQAPIMVAAQELRSPAVVERVHASTVPVTIDSGAFGKAPPTIEEYIELVRRVEDAPALQWYATLDTIGRQFRGDLNYMLMRQAGLDPLWVYQMGAYAQGRSLRAKLEQHDVIGVGGLAKAMNGDLRRIMRAVEQLGLMLDVCGCRAHFFGVGSPAVLRAFAGEPWFASCDTTKWLYGTRFGTIIGPDGQRTNPADLGYHFTPIECAAQNMRQIQSWVHAPSPSLFTATN